MKRLTPSVAEFACLAKMATLLRQREQRQRLQRLFFPEGVAFRGKAFDRTVVTSSLFEYLRPPDVSNENLVDQTGIEPVTS